MNDDIKSFYTAIILSLALIFITNHFFFKKDITPEAPAVAVNAPETENKTPAAESQPDAVLSSQAAVAAFPHIDISTPALTGSFRTRG